MTETGTSIGTPHYMSPEQATADKQITARSDVYSLASVLYEMLAGEPPHTGGSAQAIIMKIIAERAQPVEELRKSVPHNVAAALGKGLEKLPADRFGSAKAFADALADDRFTIVPAGAAGAAAVPTAGRTWIGNPRSIGLTAFAIAASALALWGWLRSPAPPSSIRYRIALTGQEIAPRLVGRDLALSPDGRTIVFSDTVGGERHLWIKTADRADAEVLTGTAGGRAPAFSPDGEWVAFIADGRLRKVPSAGGTAVTLADSANTENGPSVAWLENGTVAFNDPEYRVRVVDQDGGPVHTWTYDTAAVSIGGLPGGRGVLVGLCTSGCGITRLVTLDFESGDWAPLSDEGVRGWSLSDGRVVFVRPDGTVLAAPFDAGTRRFTSTPVPVLEGVRTTGSTADLALSHNGTLLFVPGGAATGGSRADVVWVDRTGAASPVDPGWSIRGWTRGGFAVSPDGTRLAIALIAAGHEDVWIKELDRGAESRLTFSDSVNFGPRWTPDGQAVTFLSGRAGNSDLYQRRADGTGTDSLVLDLETPILEALWSRDRQWLVLRLNSGNQDVRDIVALRPGQDSVPRPLLTAPWDETAPALSPDGRWLAYVSTETGRREVFVRPFPDVESGKWQITTGGGTSPVWAHSGRELFFVNGNQELVSQAVAAGATFQRGEQRVLFGIGAATYTDLNETYFDVSPDDRRFLMVRRNTADDADRSTTAVLVQHWLTDLRGERRANR